MRTVHFLLSIQLSYPARQDMDIYLSIWQGQCILRQKLTAGEKK